MPLRFRKMHANGDDFVVTDMRGAAGAVTGDLAPLGRSPSRNRIQPTRRHAGLCRCRQQVDFWNPNGAQLDACGSATRGVADILMRETQQSFVRVRTNRGLLQCERTSIGNISVNMGEPLLHWRDVRLSRNVNTLSVPLSGAPTACRMGNPHCTFFVNDLSAIDVAALGPTIEHHPLFPQKTNVHFVQLARMRARRGHPIGVRLVRGGKLAAFAADCSTTPWTSNAMVGT
jgi:diaminopimelate epimerase